jgi:hypothetical protein
MRNKKNVCTNLSLTPFHKTISECLNLNLSELMRKELENKIKGMFPEIRHVDLFKEWLKDITTSSKAIVDIDREEYVDEYYEDVCKFLAHDTLRLDGPVFTDGTIHFKINQDGLKLTDWILKTDPKEKRIGCKLIQITNVIEVLEILTRKNFLGVDYNNVIERFPEYKLRVAYLKYIMVEGSLWKN